MPRISLISVRDFLIWSADALGIDLEFKGSGEDEVGIVANIKGNKAPNLSVGDVIVRIDKRYFRPAEVENLLGDPSKAKKILGWEPEISAKEMCKEMVKEDYKIALRHKLLKDKGFELPISTEN